MSFDPISAGVEGAIGLGEAAVGLINSGKLKKEAEQQQENRPKLTASPFVRNQLNLADSELGAGMGADATRGYEEGIDRDLSTSLSAILEGGGSVNNVSKIFGGATQGRQRLAMMKENVRLNNINNVVRAQDAAEQERQQMFEVNELDPWKDKTQAIGQERAAANKQIWAGIDTAGGGLLKGLEGGKSKSDYDKYFQTNSENSKPDDWYGKDTFGFDTSGGGDNGGGSGDFLNSLLKD